MKPAAETVIVDTILDAISDQRLRAGTKLGEQALSELFSCNRTQVRRALATLTGYHVVEHVPNRGAFVATPTAVEAGEVFEARRAIEATIARNAAARATEADIAGLRAHLAQETGLPAGGDRPEAIRLSRAFHLELARIAGNRVLAQYLSDLTLRTSLIIGLYGRSRTALCGADDHTGIVEALASGDSEGTAERARAHLHRIEAGIDVTAVPPHSGPLASILPGPDETG